MKIGSILKDSFILFAITLVLGLALSGAKVATQDAIDEAARIKKEKGFKEVCKISDAEASSITYDDITASCLGIQDSFSDYESKNPPVLLADKKGTDAVYKVNDQNGIRGFITQVTSKGFGGSLKLIVGFDTNGNITGVKYSETPGETPGVGMKTMQSFFLDRWLGKNKSNVASVDTISGATISSTGFKDAVRLACEVADVAKNQ